MLSAERSDNFLMEGGKIQFILTVIEKILKFNIRHTYQRQQKPRELKIH